MEFHYNSVAKKYQRNANSYILLQTSSTKLRDMSSRDELYFFADIVINRKQPWLYFLLYFKVT